MTPAVAKEAFLRQIADEAAGENLEDLSGEELNAFADGLWSWAASMPPGERAVRIRPVSCSDGRKLQSVVLEAAGRDAPFLVDSLLGECVSRGHEVTALLHPIVDGPDGETQSLIQIHLRPMSEADQAGLLDGAQRTLADLSIAVADYGAMRERMQDEARKLSEHKHIDPDIRAESVAFLEWLIHEHFLFLGSRAYDFDTGPDGAFRAEEPIMIEGSNLGILKDEELNILNRGAEPTMLTEQIGAFLQEPEPLIVAKSTLVSRVHRRALADYVGIKQYDENGKVSGEIRFAGLFTAEAYNETIQSIPIVRRRVAKVLEASGRRQSRHSENALSNILETWPRDELFQSDEDELTQTALGVLHLIGQPRTRLFLRFDEFDRYVSAVVYVIREAYSSDLRQAIGAKLEDALGGTIQFFQPRFDGGPLARVHFHIALDTNHPLPDFTALEADIAQLARRWDDSLRDILAEASLKDGSTAFIGGFNEAYRAAFSPDEAVLDIAELAELSSAAPVRMRAYRQAGDDDQMMRAKIYAREGAIPLSRCVPVLENMGLFVEFETGYPVKPSRAPVPDAPEVYWVHDATVRRQDDASIDLTAVDEAFEAAFAAVWLGLTENDGFNQLILAAGLTWREAALFRALSAFRKQTGLDPAGQTQIQSLVANPDVTKALLELFETRFNPVAGGALEERAKAAASRRTAIDAKLAQVPSLDHDRVLRRLADLIMAIQRTSYYQTEADGSPRRVLAFKIASEDIADLPEPKPYREIFVSSPIVDGVHLRFGPVARGGLRWSDRRDDFRTEVLGLVKAQQVKNAVIVPTGSKGGFYPKTIPMGASREVVRECGVAAYRAFITALLDVTDNLVHGAVAAPDNTVVWDGEDPYLVVAADKGTATFSDIANEISEAHGFWLADAFASGGSAGYDHKKMGITARGAWEAVKRHFREVGKDIQTEPFTVIGVGDMSGDVFGNGMLLSKQIRLVAAFNHLHVFVDPDPADPERLWDERKRLFDLPRSTWADYDHALISKGGGVFERSAKSIPLSPEVKELTGLAGESATPDDLIHALLKADAELLWFGGIGTYIKAADESHADAGDRANDAIRIDAADLRVSVIGEGANLGLTQAARIAFARRGGRLNTDAIDNSAGVDSSDHEVNIKILLAESIRTGALALGERNLLLASMTDDVADNVLEHNYSQSAAISLVESSVSSDHAAYERLMKWLEERGVLNREVEGLPESDDMQVRREAGDWLRRPELSVLLAWSKITLFQDLVSSDVPDDPWFDATLKGYFPEALDRFDEARERHPLKREIIATILANRLIDAGGPAFLLRLREAGGWDNPRVARAFEAAHELLGLGELISAVHELDNKAPASLQIGLMRAAADEAGRLAAWLAREDQGAPLGEVIGDYAPCMAALRETGREALSPYEARRALRRASSYTDAGAPAELAERAAFLPAMTFGPSIRRIAEDSGVSFEDAGEAFFQTGGLLNIDRIRATADRGMRNAPFWDRLAARRVLSDLQLLQSQAACAALRDPSGVEGWARAREDAIHALTRTLVDLAEGRTWTFAKFALAADAVRGFMTASERTDKADARA